MEPVACDDCDFALQRKTMGQSRNAPMMAWSKRSKPITRLAARLH